MTNGHDGATDGLRDGFTGAVLGPEDEGYEEARSIFNSMVDRPRR